MKGYIILVPYRTIAPAIGVSDWWAFKKHLAYFLPTTMREYLTDGVLQWFKHQHQKDMSGSNWIAIIVQKHDDFHIILTTEPYEQTAGSRRCRKAAITTLCHMAAASSRIHKNLYQSCGFKTTRRHQTWGLLGDWQKDLCFFPRGTKNHWLSFSLRGFSSTPAQFAGCRSMAPLAAGSFVFYRSNRESQFQLFYPKKLAIINPCNIVASPCFWFINMTSATLFHWFI